MAKNVHVTPFTGGGWQVKVGGEPEARKVTETKEEAVDAGRELAKEMKTELVIHGKNGVIQTKDSYGNDPRGNG